MGAELANLFVNLAIVGPPIVGVVLVLVLTGFGISAFVRAGNATIRSTHKED